MAEQEQRQFLEEHVVPEKRGMIGGKAIEAFAGGRLQKTTFAATCEVCGRYPLDSWMTCLSCHARLCTGDSKCCCHKWNGMPYCRRCLNEVFPLSRNGYKVLMCIHAGIDDAGKIRDVTKIPKDDVKASLSFLVERKLISSSGLFAFLSREITADGMQALSVYKNVFGNDEDAREVEQKLAEEDDNGN